MDKFLHRFELRIALLAMAALFVAQLGALAHAYSHDPSAAARHAGTGAHTACGDCLGFAPLLSAAGAPKPLALVTAPSAPARATAAHHARVVRRPLLAFRSRAPPTIA